MKQQNNSEKDTSANKKTIQIVNLNKMGSTPITIKTRVLGRGILVCPVF
jgi:hypothetical protein